MPLNAQREFIEARGFSSDALAELLGLEEWIDPPDGDFSPCQARSALRERHAMAERKFRNARAPEAMASNIARLAELVGLTPVDCRILELVILLHMERVFDDVADWLGYLSSVKLNHALAVILDLPEAEISRALSAQGALAKSGLVSVDRTGTLILRRKLGLISEDFADSILTSADDPVHLLRGIVLPLPPAELHLGDYAHVSDALSIVRPYLRQSLAQGRSGVNVFIYGDPGTGKSQLAQVLGEDMGCEVFAVASEDNEGDPVNGERRLRAFRAAQTFFAQRRALIVFDEVEDVFNDGSGIFGRKSTAQTRKAWINRMLEENPVPALWLSNSIDCVDPAFVRRFDMVIELPVPPQSQRERIVRAACDGLVSERAVRRIAESADLAPAIITRAASVIATIRDELPPSRTDNALVQLISATLEGQRHAPLKKDDPNRLPDYYDPAFIAIDCDLQAVRDGLAASPSGRLCLYGPPGTGKTAWGRWLAEELGQPLMVQRASDLLSMWVGGTEKNLARAFKEAEDSHAVLLIDEVDSFLQDRRSASRSWEVSGVNEMLTQMEGFSGIFIASTNLMDGLDQAALRRFDLKLRFGYLGTEKAWQLLQRQCAALAIPAPEAALRPRLARLATLTPGDFAAAARQNRFHPYQTADALVAALAAECALKEDDGMRIGFV